MADINYDDSVLNTQDDLSAVDFDNLEFGGIASEGRHLVVFKSVKGYIFNFKDYTGPRAKFKMQVIEGPDKSDTNRFVYDDLNLPHPQEKDGNRNRRALIATRLGLIQKGQSAAKINWKDLEGTQAVITVEHGLGANGKKYANVSFAGYEPAAVWWETHSHPAIPGGANQETWDDI